MERKIDEEFDHKRSVLKVVEGAGCGGCYFFVGYDCTDDIIFGGGHCSADGRTDEKSVKFIKIEKP